MFRAYARFTLNHPILHSINLLIVLFIFIFSSYQLLANENIIYATGFLLTIFPTIIFAKSSDYRRKYLSTDN
ncbi:hypothetical protein C9I92_03645 [Photobacterium ganghwense]|nr:hypothetical protein C9I92_03645 [Photobacterium ganghwense]